MLKIPTKVSSAAEVIVLYQDYQFLGHRLRRVKHTVQFIDSLQVARHALEVVGITIDKSEFNRVISEQEARLVDLFNSR